MEINAMPHLIEIMLLRIHVIAYVHCTFVILLTPLIYNNNRYTSAYTHAKMYMPAKVDMIFH